MQRGLSTMGDIGFRCDLLGTEFPENGTLSDWAQLADLDFQIRSSPVLYDIDGTLREVPERKILWCDDSGDWLGDVGRSYKPVQPLDILAIFHDLSQRVGGRLCTARRLFHGRRIIALVQLGAPAVLVDPQDRVQLGLLLSTSCDGTMATEIRVVGLFSLGQFTIPLGEGDRPTIRIPHRTEVSPRLIRGQIDVESYKAQFGVFISVLERAARLPISVADARRLTMDLFTPAIESSQPVVTVLEMLASSPRSRYIEGRAYLDLTAWGWASTCAEYIDHMMRAHTTSRGDADENRFDSALFGRGAMLKATLYRMLAGMVE